VSAGVDSDWNDRKKFLVQLSGQAEEQSWSQAHLCTPLVVAGFRRSARPGKACDQRSWNAINSAGKGKRKREEPHGIEARLLAS